MKAFFIKVLQLGRAYHSKKMYEVLQGRRMYFYTLNKYHKRSGALIATIAGVVFARSKKEAEEIAWAKDGDDYSSGLQVSDIRDDGVSRWISIN
jgi:hypothetical protein